MLIALTLVLALVAIIAVIAGFGLMSESNPWGLLLLVVAALAVVGVFKMNTLIERAQAEETLKAAGDVQPATFDDVRRFASFKVHKKYDLNGRYVLRIDDGNSNQLSIEVRNDVYDRMLEDRTVGERLFAVARPDAQPKHEDKPLTGMGLPRMTRAQLTTTYGVVQEKLGDLGQRILIITINGKRVCFLADDEAFDSVEAGQQLPLQK